MRALHTIAEKVARATNAPQAGVVVTALEGSDPQYVIWSIRRDGALSQHRLSAPCTDEQRLAAHVRGFVSNHLAHWAQRA